MPRQRITAVAVDDCPVCDEIATLHSYGWDAAQILQALHRNAEAVGRHVKEHAPHLHPIIAEEVRLFSAERIARRRGTQ